MKNRPTLWIISLIFMSLLHTAMSLTCAEKIDSICDPDIAGIDCY